METIRSLNPKTLKKKLNTFMQNYSKKRQEKALNTARLKTLKEKYKTKRSINLENSISTKLKTIRGNNRNELEKNLENAKRIYGKRSKLRKYYNRLTKKISTIFSRKKKNTVSNRVNNTAKKRSNNGASSVSPSPPAKYKFAIKQYDPSNTHLSSKNLEDIYSKTVSSVFKPSNAYYIGGHGEQDMNRTFTVPDNCIIIAKALPGEFGFKYALSKYLQTICMQKNKDIFKDPLNHLEKIYELFGSVSIFKPGDKCPLFKYTLKPSFGREEVIPPGGIVDFDTFANKEFCYNHFIGAPITLNYNTVYNKGTFKQFVRTVYKHSVYPNINIINDIMNDQNFYWTPSNSYRLFHDVLPDTLKNYDNSLDINQERLCQKFPGVYYNFVCRAVDGPSQSLYQHDLPVDFAKNLAVTPLRQLHSREYLSRAQQKLLNAKIEEILIHRKPYVVKYLSSDRYKIKKAIKNIKENETLSDSEKLKKMVELANQGAYTKFPDLFFKNVILG